MSQVWKPQSNLVYEDWIDRIIADSEASCKELNDWELKFIHSIQMRLKMKQFISQAIADKLEEIYIKYTKD